MEKIGKALSNYSGNTLLDKLLLFELTLFCFLTGNSDMHLKNFSMIEASYGWILSPAYDLLNVAIINPEDKEELALTLEGKKNKLNREHFIKFGQGLGLTDNQVNGVFDRFRKKEPEAHSWINRSFLSTDMKKRYIQLLNQRYARLYP
jgi:serine/threonine-protein kinase HipA